MLRINPYNDVSITSLNDSMMETLVRGGPLSIGDPLTAARVGVGVKKIISLIVLIDIFCHFDVKNHYLQLLQWSILLMLYDRTLQL